MVKHSGRHSPTLHSSHHHLVSLPTLFPDDSANLSQNTLQHLEGYICFSVGGKCLAVCLFTEEDGNGDLNMVLLNS